MSVDFVAYREDIEEGLSRLGRELPGPMSGFARLHRRSNRGRGAQQ
jgi:hypothetical protein